MKQIAFIIFTLFCLYSTIGQAPGGVPGLSSWFKADQQTYLDAGITPAISNGTVVQQWNNLISNPDLPDVTKPSSGNQNLNLQNSYYNYNDVIDFTSDKFSRTVPYDAVFDPTLGLAVFTVASKAPLSFTFTSQSTSSPCGSNRCCTGFRSSVSTISNGGTPYLGTTVLSRANVIGLWGIPGSNNTNNKNGIWSTSSNANVLTNNGNYFYSIGSFPGYSFTGSIGENFTYNRNLTSNEASRIQSYLAIKYGTTLGINGTSVNYLSSSSDIVWDSTANAGYAFDIAGIARDGASGLMQIKSHSVNNTSMVFDDVITIVNGSNFLAPIGFLADESFLTWGHNGGSLNCTNTNVGTTSNGIIIGERIQRIWKAQETGTSETITIAFTMDNLQMGTFPGSYYYLLMDDDGDFSNATIAISPSGINPSTGKIYFEHNFNGTTDYFFTLGAANVVTEISGQTTICEGESTDISFNYTGTNSLIDIVYSDGIDTISLANIGQGFNVTVSPDSTTTYYTVSMEFSSCLTFTPSSTTINVTPLPEINLSDTIIACDDSIVILNAFTNQGTYLWQDLSTSASINPITSGDYWVTVTKNNCSNSDTSNITFLSLPDFSIYGDTVMCQEPILLEGTGDFDLYEWNEGTITSEIDVLESGTYSLTVTDENGCQSSQDYQVNFRCPAEIEMPNVFTPNGDGSNDYFNGTGEYLENYELKVFNRWGKLLFESNSIEMTDGWDGNTHTGNSAVEGVYYYIVNYTYLDEYQELITDNKQGNFSLLR